MDISRLIRKSLALILVLVMMVGLSSCATNDPIDPYEKYNRLAFRFNMDVDKVVYHPAAKLYTEVIPGPYRINISNFFNNLASLPAVANDLLQGDIRYAFSDSWRFIINSTVGIFGLFDVASFLGLPRHENDFGLTLSKWGVKDSPYMVVPFLGPSTIRDTIAFPVNYYLFTIWPYMAFYTSVGFHTLDLTQLRASLLPADRLLKQSFDPYVFVRNAYLQRRNKQIRRTYEDLQPGLTEEDTFVAPDEDELAAEQALRAEEAKAKGVKPKSATKPAAKKAKKPVDDVPFSEDAWINHP